MTRVFGAAIFAVLSTAAPENAFALGDVTVSVNDKGKLLVTGDDGPNALQITPGVGPGAFVVTGLSGTVINGAATAIVSGVASMKIETKKGADDVELSQVELDDALVVKLGEDADSFVIDGGRFKKKAELIGSHGADTLSVRAGARVGGILILKGGNERDTISVVNASIGGGLQINGGAGSDDVDVRYTVVDPGARTKLGLADGDDRVDLVEDDFEGKAEFYLDDGDDDLTITDCDFDDEMVAKGGADDDELRLGDGNSYDPSHRRTVGGFEDVHS